MKFIFIFLIGLTPALASTNKLAKEISLSRRDLILAEKITALLKVSSEGYYNPTLTKEVKNEISKSKHFTPFFKWVDSIDRIHAKKKAQELVLFCQENSKGMSKLSIERMLDMRVNHFCREKALELIGREIESTNSLPEYAQDFIKSNLKHFLQKNHQKSFSYFLQSQDNRPDILKKLSAEIAEYSIKKQITPSSEVLQDILIDDKLTSLVQSKGLQALEHKNVFYTEYGKLIEDGYKILNANEVDEKKLQKHVDGLMNYFNLNYNYLPVNLALGRITDFAKAISRLGYMDLSRKILQFVISKNDPSYTFEAHFFYLWTYIYTNDQKNALKYIKKESLLDVVKNVNDAQLRYWVGYVLEKDENFDTAVSLYESIIRDNPLSYYAITASKRLLNLKPESTYANFYHIEARRSISSNFKMADFDEDHQSSLIRLLAWSKIDNSRMIDLELRRLIDYSLPLFLEKRLPETHTETKEVLYLLHAEIMQESKNYLMTFRYIYNLLNSNELRFTKNVLELLYPQPYLDVLKRNLKNHDPLLVLSLIRQESVFNPQARSPVGARGLMQIMPTTARQLRRSVKPNQLTNPTVNIELGTKYFQNLMKRYDNNLVYVLAAYNAGETRVARWRKQYFDEEETIVRNIESIPFNETRTYVKLIFRNLFFYKLLNNTEVVDNKENNIIFGVHLGFKK